jgi:hypothetical protein
LSACSLGLKGIFDVSATALIRVVQGQFLILFTY